MYVRGGETVTFRFRGNPRRRCCAFGTHTCCLSGRPTRLGAHLFSPNRGAHLLRRRLEGISDACLPGSSPDSQPPPPSRFPRFRARARILVRILVNFSRNRHGAARRAPAGHAQDSSRARAPFMPPPFSAAAMASPRGRRKARRRPRPRRGRHHDPSGHHLPGAPRRRAAAPARRPRRGRGVGGRPPGGRARRVLRGRLRRRHSIGCGLERPGGFAVVVRRPEDHGRGTASSGGEAGRVDALGRRGRGALVA